MHEKNVKPEKTIKLQLDEFSGKDELNATHLHIFCMKTVTLPNANCTSLNLS